MTFTPGLALSQFFFEDAVKPILAAHCPQLEYAAALIGPGSEVLGFDTLVSTDHHWGPRVMLFLRVSDLSAHRHAIELRLSHELPCTFLGYPTNFGPPDDIGVRLLIPIDSGPVAHRVEVTSVPAWFTDYIGWDTRSTPSIVDWLTFPEHHLRAATAGAVFQDDIGELTAARTMLAWYPHDVWLYLLAAQWNRIAEEEAFMARCGDVGDELGSRLVAARLVRDLMRLCFLMQRQYAPYAKWFGTAFRHLPIASSLEPLLLQALSGETWNVREHALTGACEQIAQAHNALGITDPLDPQARPFHGRNYLVIGAERFASAIEAALADDHVRRLPRMVGSLNQVIDATDKLEAASQRKRFARVYDET